MPEPITMGLLAAAFVALKSKSKEDEDSETKSVVEDSAAHSTETVTMSVSSIPWRPLVASELANPKYFGITLGYAMTWGQVESAFQPCAVGNIKTLGPDGNPREMGLGQLYNPDDFQRLKISPSSFRAYCVPGTQRQSRDLTSAEQLEQVRGLLDLIVLCRADVRRKMASAGVEWDESSSDFFAMVKLQHGTPAFVSALGSVSAKLGHPPASWDEFCSVLPRVVNYTAADVARVLANATKTAAGA